MLLWFLALFLSITPLQVKLHPQGFHPAPVPAQVEVRVHPNAFNRLLIVVLENEETYYASTERQLDGASAPVIFRFDFRDLPVGDYFVHVQLVRVVEGKVETHYASIEGLQVH